MLRKSFVPNVVKNLPEVSPEMENYWNSHPKELQEFLAGLAGQDWQVWDGVIYFTVTSDGTTGPQWIERLKKKGKRVGDYAMGVLLSSDFKPTTGVTTKIAVLPSKLFFKEKNRATTSKILNLARRWKLIRPHAETTCLIRDKFSDKDIEAMGFVYIVVFHEPIKVSTGHPNMLSASREGYGHLLDAVCGKPDRKWDRHGGFAFAEASK